MLLVLLHAMVVMGLSLPIGWGVVRLLTAWGGDRLKTPSLSWVMLSAWAAWSGWGSLLSFFIPLGATWLLPTSGAVVLALSWWQRRELGAYLQNKWQQLRAWHWLPKLLLLACGLVAWGRAAMPGQVSDEALYYLPFIRWVQAYEVVPGLGHLHGRFAFNSHWHLLHALFDWRLPSPLLDLNAYLFLIIMGFALGRLDRVIRGSRDYLDLLACLFPWPTALWLRELTSPAADLVQIYLTWFLAWWMLWLLARPKEERRAYLPLMVWLAAWAVTIKLSGVLLLLIPAWLLWRQGYGSWLWQSAILGAVLLLPWMGRTFLLSGYWLYPVPFTGWFAPDWQMPVSLLEGEAIAIKGWARRPGSGFAEMASSPLSVWLPIWWERMRVVIRLMLILGPLYLLFTLGTAWRKGEKAAFWRWQAPLAVVLAALLMFWFTQAPDPRFGLGGIALAALLPLAAWLYRARNWRYYPWLISLLFVAAIVPTFRDFGEGPLLLPPERPEAKVEAITVNGRQVWLAKDGLCEDHPLPCAAFRQPLNQVEWRGDDWGDGLRKKVD